jgi:hypothetical protein
VAATVLNGRKFYDHGRKSPNGLCSDFSLAPPGKFLRGNKMKAERAVKAIYCDARRAAAVGLAVTLTLGIAKLIGGSLGHSLVLLSDSVHLFGDTLASATIIVALWWAQWPADREHPYGHARIETIAASNVALLLMLSAIWIIWEAIVVHGHLSELELESCHLPTTLRIPRKIRTNGRLATSR